MNNHRKLESYLVRSQSRLDQCDMILSTPEMRNWLSIIGDATDEETVIAAKSDPSAIRMLARFLLWRGEFTRMKSELDSQKLNDDIGES